MEFRTFYDRIGQHQPTHVEIITEHSPVEPNLSLTLEEIFERWKRNQPLDIITRNGSYDFDGRELTESEEDEVLNDCEERKDISEYDMTPPNFEREEKAEEASEAKREEAPEAAESR